MAAQPRLFPPDAIICKVASEPAVLLGAGRALLLQVAHPVVASGVAEFSNFRANPFVRLLGTMEATYSVVFGSSELAMGVGRRIQWIHDRIVGATYRANDPVNLLWVHATLFDTMRMFFTSLIRPFTGDEEEELYQQMVKVATLFGLAVHDQPATVAAFDRYFSSTLDAIEVGETARTLARDIVQPDLTFLRWPIPAVLSPPTKLFRLWAIGTTPSTVRSALELPWSDRDERHLLTARRTAATIFQFTPRQVRVTPGWLQGRYLLHRAGTHVAQFDARTTSLPT